MTKPLPVQNREGLQLTGYCWPQTPHGKDCDSMQFPFSSYT
ncbi:hypothetical protein ACGF5F_29485 [Streptomyces sp. NPDC047821]